MSRNNEVIEAFDFCGCFDFISVVALDSGVYYLCKNCEKEINTNSDETPCQWLSTTNSTARVQPLQG